MSAADPDGIDGEPFHPILDKPWTWELVEFTFRRDRTSWDESYIDLVFEREEVTRRLRFFGPYFQGMKGFDGTGGLYILDITGRQHEHHRVLVDNFEGHSSTPRFWAMRVEDMTPSEARP